MLSTTAPLSLAAIAALAWLPHIGLAQGTSAVADPLQDAEVQAAIDIEVNAHRANRLYDRDDYPAAAAALREILSKTPDDGRAWHQLGICLIRDEQPAAAASAFQSQFDHGYAKGNAQFNLACCAATEERADVAFEHLNHAIGIGYLNQNCIEGNEHLENIRSDERYAGVVARTKELRKVLAAADRAWDRGAYEDAIPLYEDLLERGTTTGCALHRLGFAQITMGQHAAAEQSFTAQLAHDHEPGMASYNVACTHALRSNADGALDWLEQAVDLGFHSPRLMRTDEHLATLRGTPRFEAIRQQAVQHRKLPKLAQLSMELGDWEAAVEAAASILDRSSTDANALALLADAHVALGETDAAIDATRRQLVAGHGVRGGLLRLATIHHGAENYVQTAACLDQAIAAGCRDCSEVREILDATKERHELRAVRVKLADAKLLDALDAVDWHDVEQGARETLEQDPSYGPALHRLASALIRQSRLEEAAQVLEQQVKAHHRVPAARYNLARVSELSGDRDGALKSLGASVAAGFDNQDLLATDPRLEDLRRDARFSLIESQMLDGASNARAKRSSHGRK